MKVSDILMAILCVILAALIVACYVMAGRDYRTKDCGGLYVNVSKDYRFVEDTEVSDLILSKYGDPAGMKACEIDLDQIEELIDAHSAVLKSQVWMGSDNSVHVSVTQRNPIVRFQMGDKGFYLDKTGCIFPLQSNYTASVPILDGNLPIEIGDGYKGEAKTPEDRLWVDDVLEMVEVMKGGLWEDNISQIRVVNENEIILIPRTGNEKFYFGGPQNAADKFARIEKYYTHIKPSKEKGYYSSVDVRYKGQIICRQ